jgi:hypothetical protein
MATQSLLWTALPNGLTDDGEGIRASVVLSPRLTPAAAELPRLATFAPDWVDWPATLAQATFEFAYGTASVAVPMNQTVGPNRVDLRIGSADSVVWTALFHEDLLVRAGPYVDHTGKDILSYEAADLADLVADLYGALADAADGDLPAVTDLLNTPGWDSILDAVERIDNREHFNSDTGLRDTRRLFEEYREHRFDQLRGSAGLLARAQLFHTPPSRQVDVLNRRRHDDPRIEASWREHAKSKLPEPEDFAKQLDFHQIVGAMSSYPTVLRRLGLVVDFVLARDAFADSADAPLSVSVSFEAGLAVARTPDVSPVTHAALSPSAFEAVSNPLPGTDIRVPGRLLDLSPNQFALLQVDVDGAGLKLMNFARSLGRLASADERVDSVTRIERKVGAPALRTAGLMLVHRQRAAMLADKFKANALKNASAQDVTDGSPGAVPPELYAQDALRGFRFDIWDATSGVWRSLCRRKAVYTLGDGVTVEPEAGEEEGIVRLATTRPADPTTNPDLLWLHEAVVSWTGWSLTAPPPGRAIRPDDSVGSEAQTEAELPPGLAFSSRFRAARGSLPRLRYGREYWLRARAVDLAGNSLDPQEGDFGPEQPDVRAVPFLRYEPVAAPIVALVRRDDGTTERPAEGESMLRIAIRSFNDVPDDNDAPTSEKARRFAVPQQVSAREAEQHGMLDAGGLVDTATFDLLANQRDRDATDPAAALVEEVIPLQGPLDPAPVDTTFAVYRDGLELTYLPDPLAIEVAVRILGHPDADPEAIIPIPLYPDERTWPDALPFKIEVLDKPGEAPAYDGTTRTLYVPLPKAERATVRLSLALTKDVLHGIMGIWRWAKSPTDALERRACDGRHWMLTPWTDVEVVHAVQRPLLDPTFQELIIGRGFGDTAARPRFRAHCSIKSTDRVDLHAEWHEPSDDPAASESVAIAIDRSRTDTAFSIKLTSDDDYASKHLGAVRGGIADHTIVGPNVIDVGLKGHDLVARKLHEFKDTRYRRIEYWLEGTTRFREYLPPELLSEDDGTGTLEPTEKNITVVGPRAVRWIPSSAPPPAPDVLYVVPTFGWVRTRSDAGDPSSWRRGGGLRVYLDRPWNVTGYGEMLAVVLAPPSFDGDPESQPKGRPYKKLVTQWGNDPIWDSSFVPGMAPSRSSFPMARTAPDPTGGWLPNGAPAKEADQPPGPFGVTNLGTSPAYVDIAPHDVFYDEERRLWYCDIEVDQGASYWPFVRLALARYQPVSVYGAALSEVALADFMPLVADRWLNVRRSRDPLTRRVTVHGFAPRDSSGRQEASRGLSMSFRDRITGKTRTVTPAKLDGSTVVEVWIERLDPSQGEDFGWERVTTRGVVKPLRDAGAQTEAAPRGAAARFVSAPELERAASLKAKGDHSALLGEGLVDTLLGFLTLWDGTVRLPAEPSQDDRFRLVVAEYEEYLVDDENPYDCTPTTKGRRLVFVEHVELM